MKTLLHAAGAIALLSIAPLCFPGYRILKAHAEQAPMIAWNLRVTTWNAAAAAHNAAVATSKGAEAATYLAKLSAQLANEKTGAVEEVRKIRTRSLDTINSAIGFLDRRVGDSLTRVDGSLTRVDHALEIVERLEKKLGPTLDHAGSITGMVDQAAKENIPCVDPLTGKGRGDCWPSRITAIMGGASKFLGEGAQAARRIDAALPEYLKLGKEVGGNVSGITSDFHGVTTDLRKVTSKFTAPRTKKQKAWDTIQTILLLGGRAALSR